jgi:hypothetical protein
MSLATLKHIFSTSGKEAVLALVERQYDVRIQPAAVDIEIYEPNVTVAEAALQIPEFDPVLMRTALITPVEGGGYHGRTFLQYKALDARQLQLDEVFVLNVRAPITIEQVIDQMELKYGFRMEVADLGDSSTDVLYTAFGEYVHVIPNTSLRFFGSWNFLFINEAEIDLLAVVPPARTGDLADLYVNPHSTTGMV